MYTLRYVYVATYRVCMERSLPGKKIDVNARKDEDIGLSRF